MIVESNCRVVARFLWGTSGFCSGSLNHRYDKKTSLTSKCIASFHYFSYFFGQNILLKLIFITTHQTLCKIILGIYRNKDIKVKYNSHFYLWNNNLVFEPFICIVFSLQLWSFNFFPSNNVFQKNNVNVNVSRFEWVSQGF